MPIALPAHAARDVRVARYVELVVVRIELDTATVARTRVAASPAFEVASWLALAATGGRHRDLGDVGSAARFALRDSDVAAAATVLAAIWTQNSLPDFLLPRPVRSPAAGQFDQLLALIAETTAESVASEISPERLGALPLRRDRRDLAAVPGVIVAGLAKFRRLALDEVWSDLGRALRERVEWCGSRLSSGGLAELLAEVHPSVHWADNSVLLALPANHAVKLTDDELVLAPSMLTAHCLMARFDPPGQTWLAYRPQSGPPPHRRSGQPAGLLGQTRTAVLTALETVDTNRALARRLGISESTVSYHLRALAESDLITGRREGRQVSYTLTALGRRLLSSIRQNQRR